ncbi:MAG TPA: DUF4398 domain-containing protein [Thermoanaerobaculia bacterium]|nr:DUF4398 domain-containing protein [Thermoanaerobaculia bacterium]
MSSRSVLRILVLVSTLSLAGCGGPQEEMQAAQATLAAAREAGAESYAPELYGRASELLAQAGNEMKVQEGKFVLMRSHGRTKQLLRQAEAEAAKAKTEAASGKLQARSDAQTAIDAARTALDAALSAVANAPAGKDSRADLALLRGDLEVLKGRLDEAEAAQGSGDYATALERAGKVRQEAEAISADVANALRKVHRS